MTDSATDRVAIWVGESQLSLIEGLSRTPGLDIMALGGDSAMIRETADRLEAAHVADPKALAGVEADATLIADPSRIMPTDVLSAMIAEASRSHRPLLSMAPRPASIEESAELIASAVLPSPVPCFRDLPEGRRFIAAADSFETPSSASVEISGPAAETSLTGRLFDAFDLLSVWFGLPSFVDATAVRPIGSHHPTTPRRIFAMAKFPDGRAASISAGVDGGRHARITTLFGAGGRMQNLDGCLDWTGPEGEVLEHEATITRAADDFHRELAASIKSHVRMSEHGERNRSPELIVDLLATCEAVLLSSRTGEPESVDAVRRMLGRV
ncbi:MAG: hypothetical protein P8J59_12035 [Phycisphaerales bacterium]|jgi:hypothetical protein|nr:hypothetical protein [Phycisphaerales bacterium]